MKTKFVVLIIIAGIITACTLTWVFTAYRDIEKVHKNAPAYFQKSGFTIQAYEGYEGDPFLGGHDWYIVKDKNGYSYEMYLAEWRGFLMMYDVKCLNAVQNTK